MQGRVVIGSFDLGMLNFAYAVLAVVPPTAARSYRAACEAVTAHTETEIVCWDRVHISEASAAVDQYIERLMAHVRDQWELFSGLDVVVIEQQLRQNTCMKCGAHALQALFAFHRKRVVMMAARQKFRGFPCATSGLRSRELKQLSVATAKDWAVQYQGRCSEQARAAFERVLLGHGGGGTTKLDDLSDAMLQALSAVYTVIESERRPLASK